MSQQPITKEPNLKEKLQEMATSWGADLFGVADLSEAMPYLLKEFGVYLQGLNRAISMAVCFPREVIDQLTEGPTHTYLHYYRVVNVRLDDLGLRIANWLQRKGYRAFPVPSSQRVSRDKLAGVFPHRLAARLAGLGWIGKSCSLITPEFGPAVRLVTVLTDAPLPADQPLEDRCGSCTLCIESCPAKAIKGAVFDPGEDQSARLAPERCDQHLNQVRAAFGKRVCGICLAVCPWGRPGRAREED
ncbi:MAG: 4Fe-4S double cluster binding domain-containing protein [Syntrophomonadaceae bacterium]|nr:4Fe-4S double cluster binding domain-containing protein [Syntrophomonadaceae bacterium]